MTTFNEDVTINDHKLVLRDGDGREVARLDQNGVLSLHKEVSDSSVEILRFLLFGIFGITPSAWLSVGAAGAPGLVTIRNAAGLEVLHLDGNGGTLTIGAEGDGGRLRVRDSAGLDTIVAAGEGAVLTVGVSGSAGDLRVRDGSGRRVFDMTASNAALRIGAEGNEGDIFVTDRAGVDRIHLDGQSGDITLTGADLAEEMIAVGPVRPGEVLVSIGGEEVTAASAPFDRRVVGVVSGAGDLQPALRLGTRPGERRVPVAMVGRVYCQVDARFGGIAIGDLLTTSTTVGHAMRVDDRAAAIGAIIGKALAPLPSGTGLVPVLLTQQ